MRTSTMWGVTAGGILVMLHGIWSGARWTMAPAWAQPWLEAADIFVLVFAVFMWGVVTSWLFDDLYPDQAGKDAAAEDEDARWRRTLEGKT